MKKVLISVATFVFILAAGSGVGLLWTSFFPPEERGVRVATTDANGMVKAHAGDAKTILKQTGFRGGNGRVSVTMFKDTRTPVSMDIANARQARDEQIAIARGGFLPAPDRFLEGYTHDWVSSGIPVYTCTHVTAAGRITRDPITAAGPDGINLDAMNAETRSAFVQEHGDRAKVLPGVPWGTFIGKVCADAGGNSCQTPFPIGQSAYLSAERVGAGTLWIWTNGFVAQSSTGLLNRSDFNVYQGGFRFEHEAAPEYKCKGGF
ncbi:MAG: hypothetical protein A3B10_02800 [Candidatus Doudnabacteria bacterium RIFCSPLOWO2_01_FULL_44_21]|uniref:Uncharacterized protein n=1 Tax=Candidatus Doudnabacteria bacterium RIFCSPLOWO2_01_FULL_44_21 TaxID=1817841 RepID=A0A1F5Q240_9BACT|nr:MAG: hypothetical protein A3B95_03070 [Candidatus Doudnabacteria bacterium RIFCSPHIGHO2_02_FULL_43_13b]OGE96216.1 MAG: hypothetical protein A3B10_02800 [Candidatus Doudnabacteria bacterium RIFCSPLOWO2_01_FULL_44_21]